MNMLYHKKIVRVIFFYLILSFSSLGFSQIKVNTKFPDLNTFKLESNESYDLKGKILLIDFWASWCLPCKDAFPILNEIQKEYSKKDVIIVGINVDRDKKSMSRFLKKNNCDFLVLHDASKDLVSKIDIKSLPTSFIVAPNGIIESVHVGFNKKTTKKDYIISLNKLISQNSRKNGK